MVFRYFRENIPCELLGIYKLVFVNNNFSDEGSFHLWARYATYFVFKYLDTATVKASTNVYKTTFPSDIIFTKSDASNSDKHDEKLTKEFNIHYRACIISLIYFLSTRLDLSFSVHKLATFSLNRGKVHFESLVNLLMYIKYNKTLGLKYADMNDVPLSFLLKQASIKTENKFMDFSDSSWQDCPDTGRSTLAYNIFYQGGSIYHGKHVPWPVAQSVAESEYNSSCIAVIALANFIVLIHELLNKDPDIVPERAPLIIFCSKSSVCLVNNS